jgi:sugar phosphate isomerase/epimerase
MKHEVSRRNILRGGALLTGSMMLPEVNAVAAPLKAVGVPPFQLGLASYTFRNFDRSQLIGFMKQLGLTALNAKDAKNHLPMDAAAEAAAVADYNAAGIALHAVGTVSFSKPDEADIRSKFDYAKRAGVKVIVAGDPDTKSLPIMERFVKEYDIRIAIHNHGPEDAKYFPSPLDVLKAIKGMDPRMGCCIDVGHCERAGTDPVAAIHAVGPRLFNMHVKDLTDFKSRESQVAVGEGKIPFRAIFEALTATGYKGFVDLEYEIHGDDPMPGVIESFAYMRGVLNGMGYQKAS